jgi:hypothetical protein
MRQWVSAQLYRNVTLGDEDGVELTPEAPASSKSPEAVATVTVRPWSSFDARHPR